MHGLRQNVCPSNASGGGQESPVRAPIGMDARLVAAVLTDNRRAEVHLREHAASGARRLGERLGERSGLQVNKVVEGWSSRHG
jgi:hypothetical protein